MVEDTSLTYETTKFQINLPWTYNSSELANTYNQLLIQHKRFLHPIYFAS